MPLELGIWRIDNGLNRLDFCSLDLESRLEGILDTDITIADPRWMVIGRQVLTDFGSYVDLLAIDRDGNLVVIELKRDKTPRDIVAQVLDYGSWVSGLGAEFIARTFQNYLKKYHPERPSLSLDEAFRARFGVSEMPEELNENHELVIVASVLDTSTERIVKYLVGIVQDPVVNIDDFMVPDAQGKSVPIVSLPVKAASLTKASKSEERAEKLVRVKWVKTVPLAQAIKEKGFFGNQNTVAQPTTTCEPLIRLMLMTFRNRPKVRRRSLWPDSPTSLNQERYRSRP